MMNLAIARMWDFNQMLVASVFGHLLLLTFVLFLPKTTVLEKITPPAFMVELVEISTGEKKTVQKRPQKKYPHKKKVSITKPQKKLTPIPVEKTNSLPPVKIARAIPQEKTVKTIAPVKIAKAIPLAKTVKAITPIKPIVPQKLIQPIQQSIQMPLEKKPQKVNRESSDRILNSLDQLNNSPAKMKNEEIQLARLVPKVSLKKPAIKKSKPLHEETFDEMNALKNKKIEVLPGKVEPPSMENPLDQFDSMKMEEPLDVELPPNEPIVENNTNSRVKKLEFTRLSKNSVKLKKNQGEKSSVDLLKELEEMKQPRLASKEAVTSPSQEVQTPFFTHEKSQAFNSIVKKLDSLETKPKDIDTPTAVPETFTQDFQSDIRNVSAPKQVQVDVVVAPDPAYVQSPIPGKPGANILDLYKGMISARVYGNWHQPLGNEYNKNVIYSFYIYPNGNIDRLNLEKSSQVELLDDLVLSAIRESEPFPKFPEALDYKNLNINIHFNYTPEKTKNDS